MNVYIGTIILVVLLMFAMIMHVLTYSGFNKQEKAWFMLTFLTIIVCSFSELLVHCGYYNSRYSSVLTVITVIQFSISPIIPVLFSGALGLHYQAKIGVVFFIISFLVETVSVPFGYIFYFNEQGYFRGDYFFIYEIFYAIGMIYLVISLIIIGHKFQRRDILTIIMVIVVLFGGIIPMTLFMINIAYLSIGISAALCYIYYNDMIQQDIKRELVSNQKKVTNMQINIISGLSNLIENRDEDTGEHVVRTARYVKTIAQNAKNDGVYADVIDDHFIELIFSLAPLHDVGKIVVPDKILKKRGKLTQEEFEEIKKHATAGGNVIRQILEGITDEEYMEFASDIATYHHEKWDGSGYPYNLAGEDIPLSARIMAIADVFDALISERCYKKAMPVDKAVSIIKEGAGKHFDPYLVNVFIEHLEDFLD